MKFVNKRRREMTNRIEGWRKKIPVWSDLPQGVKFFIGFVFLVGLATLVLAFCGKG